MDPFSLMAKVTAVTTMSPGIGLPQICTQSKKLRKHVITNSIAHRKCQIAVSALSKYAGFAPWTHASAVVDGCQGGRRKANLLMGIVHGAAPPRTNKGPATEQNGGCGLRDGGCSCSPLLDFYVGHWAAVAVLLLPAAGSTSRSCAHHVQVIEGMNVVDQIRAVGSASGKTAAKVLIADSGVLPM